MVISICIPTLMRPVMLGRLLDSLVALDTGGAAVHVVVVDNDPSGSAEPTVRRFESLIPNLVYQVEPRRGLATARNRLVAIAASLGSDYLIFVDDDEWVEPSWLLSFVRLAAACRADVLRGPVYPEYEEGTPPWIIASKFFDPPEYPTGTPLRMTGTGNTMIRLDWLCKFDGPFDPRFDLMGGEDTHFFERIHRLGARFVWCAEAIAHERVPLSRCKVGWIIKRAFRIGVTYSQFVLMLDGAIHRRLFRTARAIARIGQGVLFLVPSLFLGRAALVRSLWFCAGRGRDHGDHELPVFGI